MRLLFLGLSLTACPVSALAQMAPSPKLLNNYARLGAITMYESYYKERKYENACYTAHKLLYLSLAPEANASAESINTIRGFIAETCS